MEKQSPKILVIEDAKDVRETIKKILEFSGYQVLTASDGKIGCQLAISQLPDLIICDILMPELDGYGVLTALRQNDATATIPLIFLTAKVERSDLRQGMELGADDYITKPFKVEELLSAVAARFERQSAYQMQLQQERDKGKELQKAAQQHRQQQDKSQQMAELKNELLNKLIADLSDPISTISLAIKMLKDASTQEQRDRYLQMLQQECEREMQLLKEISELQKVLTPENAAILQKFNLLRKEL